MLNAPEHVTDEDAAQLRALGYTSHFERSMSKWENFSLGFTYLSPVVGVYSVFATSIAAGGPPMWWAYLLVGLGQLLVCLVFGEVVSQFPISGGLYPWSRRLVGKRWAWMAGWIYAWALCATVSAVAAGATPFVATLLGLPLSAGVQLAISLLLIALVTVLNLSGTRLLARVAMFGFICELVGALAVGGYLLLFARHQSLSVILDFRSPTPGTSYPAAFLAAAVGAMFCYYGFEACGDVAEETPNASRSIPKAMRMTIYVGGGSAMFVCLALILGLPSIADVLSGKVPDPVSFTLTSALGETGYRIVVAVVLVSFMSCLLSLQAAASRLLFAYARDRMIVGSGILSRMSPRTRVPVYSLLVTGVIPALICVAGFWLVNAIAAIISFASAGIYIAFQMIVAAALFARARGWRPSGPYRLGRWGVAVNMAALLFGLTAIVDMLWPRMPQQPWFSNYGMLIGTAVIAGSGLAYMLAARPYDHGTAPFGDAHLSNPRPERQPKPDELGPQVT
ncbi:MAG TPA: APC family permease [Steroidobacteraceae bacterium]|nr:APC family permease [Steroidobacteraceae bacterium]